MARQRTDVEQQLADLLRTAKESLGVSVAFLSRMEGGTQTLEVVESSVPLLFQEGYQQARERTLCQAVLDGRLPAVMTDLREHPAAMELPAARFPRIRSFVTVPVTLSDGSLYGTFCTASLTTDHRLGKRDKALMEVLAQAAAVVVEPEVTERARRGEVMGRLGPVMDAGGPEVVLQPIVHLGTGVRAGAEALSRFPRAWGLTPDVVFAQAHELGLGDQLELLALERAADHLEVVPGYVSMNISPGTLVTPGASALLGRLPLERVLLELCEHDPVEDYEALHAVLGPLRARGMRLAIDDVGTGFSSLRHIVLTAPDVIKLDRSIVDGVAGDPVLRTLVTSLGDFAHGSGAQVVAEGVEGPEDAAALLGCRVDLAQGWHYGRPGPPGAMADRYPPAAAAVPGPRAQAGAVAAAQRGT
ncbi:EAL domain-containing protein [Vallicoccus soli]|uniref:EAL domain-containing protein n=1 Tax=Vallicoccus soli TaxID=2339232 RepID=A0A3A3YYK3_9ACTN|nr:EAL domain-containing protein [Vallicoccus soli]RJK94208.1 EAL domain-containing protein [Vallicoccus soli]